jgi:mono/diheme cytochrome c family protein
LLLRAREPLLLGIVLRADPHARCSWGPALFTITSGLSGWLPAALGRADTLAFTKPPSVASLENPYRGEASAAEAGGELYAAHCAACLGRGAEGTGNISALAHVRCPSAPDGEVF